MTTFLLPKSYVPADRRIEHRRCIRKGTQSCWECKRRKVRCNLATSKHSCDGCKRRNVTCISQEFPDDLAKAEESQLYGKVNRLENLLQILAGEIDAKNKCETRFKTSCGLLTESTSGEAGDSVEGSLLQMAHYRADEPAEKLPAEDKWPSCMLLKAWPHFRDLELLLSLPGQVPALFHGIICGPPSIVLPHGSLSASQVIHVPPNGSHPTLIMRQLLLLATWLQSASPSSLSQDGGLPTNYRELQASIFETAHRYGINNADLLDSIEGIECIMIETMYLNNAGDLRSAWHCVSRAIPIAQMMNLHQDIRLHSPRFLDRQTRTRVYPEYMWFRLVQMNRYLAMMLGLPQATTNNAFADVSILQTCSPAERMQRMDCATGGYILQRNEAGLLDKSTTQMIDDMLQESAEYLPALWWEIPDLRTCVDQGSKLLHEIARVMDQLAHYHLIAQLHLPYIASSSTNTEHEYSKRKAVDASRQVLLRYTSLQDVHAFASFCGGTNLLAFVSCTILCIAHIKAKCEQQSYLSDDETGLDPFADQRLRDRELMEITLKGMRRIARDDADPIASRTISVLAELLAMEACDAVCEKDLETSMLGGERGFGCGGRVSDSRHLLEIYIPYFGTIRFERRASTACVPGTFHII